MVLAATQYADWTVFVIASVMVLAGALGVIAARNPVHSALFLIQTLFGVAVLFIAQGAHFLAAVQVVVYAGAIVVLILFVIMLLGVDRSDALSADPLRGQRPVALVVGVLALAEFAGLARAATWATGTRSLSGTISGPGSNVEKLGRSLFSGYLLAFEVTSALLVIAVVAAVVLTKRPHPGIDTDPAETDLAGEDLSEAAVAEPTGATGATGAPESQSERV